MDSLPFLFSLDISKENRQCLGLRLEKCSLRPEPAPAQEIFTVRKHLNSSYIPPFPFALLIPPLPHTTSEIRGTISRLGSTPDLLWTPH